MDSHRFNVAIFRDETAQRVKQQAMTLAELRQVIIDEKELTKKDLRWLKLAKFGAKRSSKNSLRTDDNVEAVSGVELDYDGKKVSFEEAVAIAQARTLQCLIYATPSYTDAEPKWRILCPASKELPPGDRVNLAARVNGLFGGAFDPASFTLSQSFYFGNTERVSIVEGDYVDLCADLEKTAIGKNGERSGASFFLAYAELTESTRINVEQRLAEMRYRGEGDTAIHTTQLSVSARLMHDGVDIDEVVDRIIEATKRVAPEGWNWAKEAKTVRKMCEDWQAKHPDADNPQETFEAVTLAPYAFPDERSIPTWDFLSGTRLLRQTVCATAASGGSGKSSLSIVEAIAAASGRKLLNEDIPRPLRVLLMNLEDNRNAMDKRITAAMRHHKLKPEDIKDRLFLVAKGEMKFRIARPAAGSIKRNEKLIDWLIGFIRAQRIDVLSVDPFIATHAASENDNSAIRDVIECYSYVAEEADCAVSIWHHTRKGNGENTSVDSARGASAFVDACRSVRILETMSRDEASKLKISDPGRYFRAFSGKLNFAPPSDQSEWFTIVGMQLMNGNLPNLLPEGGNGGDNVGVVEVWDHPGAVEADISEKDIESIKEKVGGELRWRENHRASMWVGNALAKILKLDAKGDRAELIKIIRNLVARNVLTTAEGKDDKRKPVLFVVPGEGA